MCPSSEKYSNGSSTQGGPTVCYFPSYTSLGGSTRPLFPKCSVRGHQFQRACSRSPQALTLLESAKQCQPRPLFPRDASLRSVWVEVTSHLSRAQGWVPAGRFLSQHGHGTGLNELLAKGLLLNTNGFLMTKVINPCTWFKKYISNLRKKVAIPRKYFSSNPDTSWKVYTVNSFLCLFSEIF